MLSYRCLRSNRRSLDKTTYRKLVLRGLLSKVLLSMIRRPEKCVLDGYRMRLLLVGVVVVVLGGSHAKADFTFGERVNVETTIPVIEAVYESIWSFSSDGLEMYVMSWERPGGEGGNDIWVLTRSSKDDDWGPPQNLGPTINSSGHDGISSISSDGLTLYFDALRPDGYGNFDIYMTTRATRNHPWGAPVNLGSVVNGPGYDWVPWISPDGLELYFQSYDRDGHSGSDFFVARRDTPQDPWTDVMNLGPVINSPSYEERASLSPDGLLFFFGDNSGSTRAGAYGGGDLWVSRRASLSEPWQTPVNLGPQVNSAMHELGPRVSPDGSTLYFYTRTDDPVPVFTNWQAPIIPTVDFNGDHRVDIEDATLLIEHWGEDEPAYDMGPMPWGDGIVDIHDLNVLREYVDVTGPVVVHSPSLHSTEISVDVPLHWLPGEFADTHDVYFGTVYEDVKAADRNHPLDVLISRGQDANSFDPRGLMEYGQTYYWRVDEVSALPDSSIYRGPVSSFTVESYSIQVATHAMTVTASSSNEERTLPDKLIDGSGLDPNDMHSNLSQDMWMSALGDLSPWLMVEFDKPQKLDRMLIWNSNHVSEPVVGLGIKDVDIEVSLDGVDWTVIPEPNQLVQCPGGSTRAAAQVIDMGLAVAKYVRLNVLSNWTTLPTGLQQYAVAEVQFYSLPVRAGDAEPASGSVDVHPNTVIEWRAGRDAAEHTVYVSTDPDAVAEGSAPSVTSVASSLDLTSLDLQLGQTYYWRVDEVNEAQVPSVWAGPVWNFSTTPALIVDDFESYTNVSPNRPFQTWMDGMGYAADEHFPVAYAGNGSGAAVGHDIWDMTSPHFDGSIMERDNTIGDSNWSLPFYYDNADGAASHIDRHWSIPQDWSVHGVQTLVLHFYGATGNMGQLFVMINDTKIVYDGDTSNLEKPEWTAWHIDLTSLAGLQNVSTLTLGIDGALAAGVLLVDDISLHGPSGQ